MCDASPYRAIASSSAGWTRTSPATPVHSARSPRCSSTSATMAVRCCPKPILGLGAPDPLRGQTRLPPDRQRVHLVLPLQTRAVLHHLFGEVDQILVRESRPVQFADIQWGSRIGDVRLDRAGRIGNPL